MPVRQRRLVHVPSGELFNLLEPRRLMARARGLMWTDSLPPNGGMYLARCSAIHMLGMKFPLDLVWLGSDGITIWIHTYVPPGFVVRSCRGARAVIELPAGTVHRLGISLGDAWVSK